MNKSPPKQAKTFLEQIKNLEELWTIQKHIIERYKNIDVAFIALDANHDSYIYFSEFSKIMIQKGFNYSKEMLEKLFQFIDQNMDGQINSDDWRKSFENLNQHLLDLKEKLKKRTSSAEGEDSQRSKKSPSSEESKGPYVAKEMIIESTPNKSAKHSILRLENKNIGEFHLTDKKHTITIDSNSLNDSNLVLNSIEIPSGYFSSEKKTPKITKIIFGDELDSNTNSSRLTQIQQIAGNIPKIHKLYDLIDNLEYSDPENSSFQEKHLKSPEQSPQKVHARIIDSPERELVRELGGEKKLKLYRTSIESPKSLKDPLSKRTNFSSLHEHEDAQSIEKQYISPVLEKITPQLFVPLDKDITDEITSTSIKVESPRYQNLKQSPRLDFVLPRDTAEVKKLDLNDFINSQKSEQEKDLIIKKQKEKDKVIFEEDLEENDKIVSPDESNATCKFPELQSEDLIFDKTASNNQIEKVGTTTVLASENDLLAKFDEEEEKNKSISFNDNDGQVDEQNPLEPNFRPDSPDRDDNLLISEINSRYAGTDIPLDEFELYYEDEDEEGKQRYEERRKEMFRETMPKITEEDSDYSGYSNNEIPKPRSSNVSSRASPSKIARILLVDSPTRIREEAEEIQIEEDRNYGQIILEDKPTELLLELKPNNLNPCVSKKVESSDVIENSRINNDFHNPVILFDKQTSKSENENDNINKTHPNIKLGVFPKLRKKEIHSEIIPKHQEYLILGSKDFLEISKNSDLMITNFEIYDETKEEKIDNLILGTDTFSEPQRSENKMEVLIEDIKNDDVIEDLSGEASELQDSKVINETNSHIDRLISDREVFGEKLETSGNEYLVQSNQKIFTEENLDKIISNQNQEDFDLKKSVSSHKYTQEFELSAVMINDFKTDSTVRNSLSPSEKFEDQVNPTFLNIQSDNERARNRYNFASFKKIQFENELKEELQKNKTLLNSGNFKSDKKSVPILNKSESLKDKRFSFQRKIIEREENQNSALDLLLNNIDQKLRNVETKEKSQLSKKSDHNFEFSKNLHEKKISIASHDSKFGIKSIRSEEDDRKFDLSYNGDCQDVYRNLHFSKDAGSKRNLRDILSILDSNSERGNEINDQNPLLKSAEKKRNLAYHKTWSSPKDKNLQSPGSLYQTDFFNRERDNFSFGSLNQFEKISTEQSVYREKEPVYNTNKIYDMIFSPRRIADSSKKINENLVSPSSSSTYSQYDELNTLMSNSKHNDFPKRTFKSLDSYAERKSWVSENEYPVKIESHIDKKFAARYERILSSLGSDSLMAPKNENHDTDPEKLSLIESTKEFINSRKAYLLSEMARLENVNKELEKVKANLKGSQF